MVDLQATLSSGADTTLPESVIAAFKTGLRGELLTPADDTYDEVRVIWNAMHDIRPGLMARCTGAADVISAVNFARKTTFWSRCAAVVTASLARHCAKAGC